MLAVIDKDADAKIRYSISWKKWLASSPDSDVILTNSVWRVEPDGELEVDGDSRTDSITTVRLIGGELLKEYDVVNRVTASNGDEDERTIRVRIVRR